MGSPANKGARLEGWPLTRDEASALLGAAGRGWVGLRNRSLLVLMYRAGLRPAEACAVEVPHYRTKADGTGVVLVAKPKGYAGGKPPREVGVDPKVVKLLGEWLEVRGDAPGVLAGTRTGAPVDGSYLRRSIKHMAQRARIARRVHPHCMRHTFARELWEETHDLLLIMRALGHSKVDTTMHYLRSIGCTEVVERTAYREW